MGDLGANPAALRLLLLRWMRAVCGRALGGTDGKLGFRAPSSFRAPETGLLLSFAGQHPRGKGVGGRALCRGHLGSAPGGHVEAARHCGVGWSSTQTHEDGLRHLCTQYPKSHVS